MIEEYLNKIVPCFTAIVPLVFDESMSYYEQLCCVRAKINEVIEDLNNMEEKFREELKAGLEKVLQESKDYTDEEVKKIMDGIDQRFFEIAERIERVKEDSIKRDLAIEEKIEALKIDIDAKLLALKNYSDAQDEIVRIDMLTHIIKLRNDLQGLIGTGTVINPVTGNYSTIQQAINDIWNNIHPYKMTVLDWRVSEVSVLMFRKFGINVREFRYLGKLIFLTRWLRRLMWMVHPVTGEYVPVREVVQWCVDQHRNALTVDEYDNLNLEVSDYDSRNISVNDYDFKGRELLL